MSIFAIWPAFAPEMPWQCVGPLGLLAVLYLGVIAIALAYFAWFRVVATFPATVSGMSSLAVPIVGVFSSAAMLGEAIGWREIGALALICCALWLILFSMPTTSERPL